MDVEVLQRCHPPNTKAWYVQHAKYQAINVKDLPFFFVRLELSTHFSENCSLMNARVSMTSDLRCHAV